MTSEPSPSRAAAFLDRLMGSAPAPTPPPAPASPVDALLPLVRAAVRRHSSPGGPACITGLYGELWPLSDDLAPSLLAALAVDLLGHRIHLRVARLVCLLVQAEWEGADG